MELLTALLIVFLFENKKIEIYYNFFKFFRKKEIITIQIYA